VLVALVDSVEGSNKNKHGCQFISTSVLFFKQMILLGSAEDP
jgi:hypothetical protein